MEILFHIPHSSTLIPDEYKYQFALTDQELKDESFLMCDHDTDKMVDTKDVLIFDYSRLFCDVERYDSEQEIMNEIGMGVLYQKTHDLKTLRKTPSKDILWFYEQHHKKLNQMIMDKLKFGDVLFIDLHSYSKEALPYELNKDSERPEICIGINERYNPLLLDKIISVIQKFDYSYGINTPFEGCLLPSDYINDARVHGFMIEIRKDVYETETKFQKIKNFLKEFYI